MHGRVRGDQLAESGHEVRGAGEGEARGDDWLNEGAEQVFFRCSGGEGANVGDQIARVGDGRLDGGFAVVGGAVAVHVAFSDEGSLAWQGELSELGHSVRSATHLF